MRNNWILDPTDKATLIAKTLKHKCVLSEEVQNKYSEIQVAKTLQESLQLPTEEIAYNVLTELNVDSATGSDDVPAKILKMCAKALAKPIALLVMTIISTGVWPDCWRDHWIILIFKKGAVFRPENY